MCTSQLASQIGPKNPSPSMWSRWRWVSRMSTRAGWSPARETPRFLIPVPASMISMRPSDGRTWTHEGFPPYRTVSGPGAGNEPRHPQMVARDLWLLRGFAVVPEQGDGPHEFFRVREERKRGDGDVSSFPIHAVDTQRA